jgi:hypothetical protein
MKTRILSALACAALASLAATAAAQTYHARP